MTDVEQAKREQQRLALEADRLIHDETLITALERVRQSAVDALIRVDADKPTDVVRLQAKVMVCDEFMTELKTMVELQVIENRSRMS
jgi:hypothetical protein